MTNGAQKPPSSSSFNGAGSESNFQSTLAGQVKPFQPIKSSTTRSNIEWDGKLRSFLGFTGLHTIAPYGRPTCLLPGCLVYLASSWSHWSCRGKQIGIGRAQGHRFDPGYITLALYIGQSSSCSSCSKAVGEFSDSSW